MSDKQPPPSEKACDVFWEVKDLPPQDRAVFLDRACGEDHELRASVEFLLKNHTEDDLFGKIAEEVQRPNLDIEKVGDSIGHYKLLEEIGAGGCGVVYLAEQKQPFQRQVALKVIRLGMDTKQVIQRFEAERQALAQLKHSNIAKVFDAGSTSTGRPYFVMELVSGSKITDYADLHRLTIPERLDLFVKVCRAVQHAHEQGIIHRDIKPSNILVTQENGEPLPKVIDFGIAKATLGEQSDNNLLTKEGQVIGTPAYMSPEQASGEQIDRHTDIYSLGVLLHELLTSRLPQNSDLTSARFKGLAEKERLRIAQSRRSEPSLVLHALRDELDCIVMKCLQKNPNDRHDTAGGLANEIQRYLRGKRINLKRMLYPVLALIVLLLATGIIYKAINFHRTETIASDDLSTPDGITAITINMINTR